jgi:membrane fusion protein, multidrug efflux system
MGKGLTMTSLYKRKSPELLISLCAVVLGGIGCSQGGAAEKPKGGDAGGAGVPVKVAQAQQRKIARTVELSGSLASPEDSTIAAEVDGKIVGLKFDLGDRVRRGDVLARINPDEYRFRMEQAEAQKAQTEANFKRVEQLSKNEMVAPARFDDARSQAAQARAMADLARKKFGDTEVRAPFDGAVAKRSVMPGEYVKTGQALFQVVSLDPLKMTGEVPEHFLPDVHQGDQVEAHVDAFPDKAFEGKVSRVSPAVNPQSRSFSIEALIGNKDRQLRPGMFAKLHLHFAGEETSIVVPESALSAFAGVSRVFVIAGGVAHDVKSGDQVATAGLARLAEGVPVVIK